MPTNTCGLTANTGTNRRRSALHLLLGCLASVTLCSGVDAQTNDEVQVLSVVTALFDGMREKDPAKLGALFLPAARLGDADASGWIERVSTSSAYLDEVTYEESVLVDQDMAMAWTPYTLYVDGELHHCGVDVFVMRRVDSDWKILQIDDTRRPDNCPDPQG